MPLGRGRDRVFAYLSAWGHMGRVLQEAHPQGRVLGGRIYKVKCPSGEERRESRVKGSICSLLRRVGLWGAQKA